MLFPMFSICQENENEILDKIDSNLIGRLILISFDSDTILYKLKVPQLFEVDKK